MPLTMLVVTETTVYTYNKFKVFLIVVVLGGGVLSSGWISVFIVWFLRFGGCGFLVLWGRLAGIMHWFERHSHVA